MTLSAQRGGAFLSTNKVYSGVVKVIHKKGYAFFTDSESEKEYFCPPNLVHGINVKDNIEYEITFQNNGKTAVNKIISVNGEKKLTIAKKILQKAKKIQCRCW